MSDPGLAAEIRQVVADVLDKGDASWRAMAEAGVLSLVAPEEYDGSGLGPTALAVVLDEPAFLIEAHEPQARRAQGSALGESVGERRCGHPGRARP